MNKNTEYWNDFLNTWFNIYLKHYGTYPPDDLISLVYINHDEYIFGDTVNSKYDLFSPDNNFSIEDELIELERRVQRLIDDSNSVGKIIEEMTGEE